MPLGIDVWSDLGNSYVQNEVNKLELKWDEAFVLSLETTKNTNKMKPRGFYRFRKLRGSELGTKIDQTSVPRWHPKI